MVVNGYSQSGLEFSRNANTDKELDAAVADAWDTPHVTDVTVDYVKGGE